MAKFFPGAGLISGWPWAPSQPSAPQAQLPFITARPTLAIVASAFVIVALAAAALRFGGMWAPVEVAAEPVGFQPGPYVRAEVAAGYLSR